MNILKASGIIKSLNISKEKGVKKTPVDTVILIENEGIEGDAHRNPDDETRQVSILAYESIEKQNKLLAEKGESITLTSGDFAENITTEGIDFENINIGDRLNIGETILELSRKGKECIKRCSVYYRTGDCVMPREGVFVRVIKGDEIKVGDKIEVYRGDND